MIVVKVGGSLYNHPRLATGLRKYLESLDEPLLIVPGGGPFAETVRDLDHNQKLGEEKSHWLAIEAMNRAGEFLNSLGITTPVLDALAFGREHDVLPHSWDVTSDSIAAQAAIVNGASRLILLKSVSIPRSMPWPESSERGWVDPHFPKLVADVRFGIEVVNFRQYLDSFSEPG